MKVAVTAYASDIGANQSGSAEGVYVLQKLKHLMPSCLEWTKILKSAEKNRQLDATPIIYELCKKLALQTMNEMREGKRFLTLGGRP